jgi:D-tyrosyl-tRNA(Tyr) deacylase
MKVLLQRVSHASVTVNDKIVGEISRGLLALVGIAPTDGDAEVDWMVDKITQLRIFEDDQGKMNRSLLEVAGAMLVVSQFTLMADCRKGRRPAFTDAAPPEHANLMYEKLVAAVTKCGVPVQTGIFAANMQVALVNDGPVTIMLQRPES